MIIIEAQEKYLSFKGDQYYALNLINSLRESYGSNDMPKMLRTASTAVLMPSGTPFLLTIKRFSR